MGYRSEVAILLSEEAVKLMTDELKKMFDETFEIIQKRDDGCMLYHTNSCKWYQGYEEVDAIEGFLATLNEKGDEIEDCGGEFLRIGEDEDDIEHDIYGDWDYERLLVETYISVEGEKIAAEKKDEDIPAEPIDK